MYLKFLYSILVGLACFGTATSQNLHFEKVSDLPQGTNTVNNLSFNNGKLWVATNQGISIRGLNASEEYVEGLNVSALGFDQQGNTWFGTSEGTLHKSKDGSNELIALPPNVIDSEQAITALAIGSAKVWMGTDKGTILGMDKNGDYYEHIPSEYRGKVSSFVLEDGRAKLIGRGNGLFISPKKYTKWFEYKNIKEVKKIIYRSGTYWLIGESASGESALLKSKDLLDWEAQPISCRDLKVSGTTFNDFLIDGKQIWIATQDGIIHFDRKTKICVLIGKKNYPEFGLKNVENIAVENDTTLWASNSKQGLHKITLRKDEGLALEELESVDRRNLTGLNDINCNDTLLLNQLIFKPSTADFLNGAEARAQMDILVSYLNQNESNALELMGHTDNVSSNKQYLVDLSEKRVERVRKYLMSKGVKKSRIKTIAYGGSKPIITKGDENREKNRRVEVFIKCKYGY